MQEDEVIHAFLRSELNSPRFGAATRDALATVAEIDLLTDPDFSSATANSARRAALAAARGWGTGEGLFAGFPDVLSWTHGMLEPTELDRLRFIDSSYWNELSGHTRRPDQVSATVADGLPTWVTDIGLEWILDLAEIIARRPHVSDLIVVGTPDLAELVVLEGHARLTAIFVGGLQSQVTASAYVGTSVDISAWQLF